ncbi:MAG: hypothetical protein Ct9H300mP21_05950 [Pseudomonadota bacterium]|nr:MAG: hypothetical protein Ct9H300mP21_05950 [Pseudomonadota bacterium]
MDSHDSCRYWDPAHDPGWIVGRTLFGNLTAFTAAVGFAGFTFFLRWGKNKNMLPAVCYAGLFTLFFSAFAAVF